MTTPRAALEVRGLSRRFGRTDALVDVDLTVGPGEMLALLGPSGCGKTTLLRIIAGLESADSGTVRLGGELLTRPGHRVPPERRRIGMVFHDWALFPHLSVARNVAYGLTRQEARSGRVEEALAMVHLGELADRKPHQLSAGQMQRVALARALAPRPDILLFDEPFSALDAELRATVRREVADLMRELGMTAVFVTHDQQEAFVLGDRIAVMRAGRIVQSAEPAVIYDAPATAWVAGFVGDANLLPARASGVSAATELGAIALREGVEGDCFVLLRPEHLSIGAPSSGSPTDGSEVPGVVTAVDFFGHDTTYRVRISPTVPGLLVRQMTVPAHSVGERVVLSYTGPAACHFPPVPTSD